MRYEIRELNLGGILDQAIKLIKNNLGRFFGITAVLLIPYQVVQGLVQVTMTPALPPNPTPEQALAASFGALSTILPLALLGAYVIFPLTNAALIHSIAGEYLEKPAGVGESLKWALQRILGLIGTWLLLGLAIMGGFMLCIVPGIIASFWFALATQVVVIEGTAGIAALKRSKELMKGNIGTFFVLMLLVGIITGGVGAAAGLIPQAYVMVAVVALIQAVTTIFASAAVVVFYFSARCKHEQFDLTLLAQSVGIEAPAPEAQASAPEG
jgi:hypothetical protein